MNAENSTAASRYSIISFFGLYSQGTEAMIWIEQTIDEAKSRKSNAKIWGRAHSETNDEGEERGTAAAKEKREKSAVLLLVLHEPLDAPLTTVTLYPVTKFKGPEGDSPVMTPEESEIPPEEPCDDAPVPDHVTMNWWQFAYFKFE